jgi:hypothetical protein
LYGAFVWAHRRVAAQNGVFRLGQYGEDSLAALELSDMRYVVPYDGGVGQMEASVAPVFLRVLSAFPYAPL